MPSQASNLPIDRTSALASAPTSVAPATPPASQATATTATVKPADLRRALRDGYLAPRFQDLLTMRSDVRKALFSESMTADELHRLFRLGLAKTLRIMLINELTVTPWFGQLDAEDRAVILASVVTKPGASTPTPTPTSFAASAASTPSRPPASSSSSLSRDRPLDRRQDRQQTPVPIPAQLSGYGPSPLSTPSSQSLSRVASVAAAASAAASASAADSGSGTPGPSPASASRPVFMAKRTGRSILSPRLPADGSNSDGEGRRASPTADKQAADIADSPMPATITSDLVPSSTQPEQPEPRKRKADFHIDWSDDESSGTGSIMAKRARLLKDGKAPARATVTFNPEDSVIEFENSKSGSDGGSSVGDESDDSDEDETRASGHPDSSDDQDVSLQEKMQDVIVATPSARMYNKWMDPVQGLISTQGALLPDGYKKSDTPGTPWACPIRSCRQMFSTLSGLGHHFCSRHRSTSLNDNLDGTFSVLKNVNVPNRLGACVVSQKRLVDDESLAASNVSKSQPGQISKVPPADRKTKKHGKSPLSSNLVRINVATDGRLYSMIPFAMRPDETVVSGHGALIPGRYKQSTFPGHPWVCPVRTCRRVFEKISNLGAHFTRQHRHGMFNDNGDGTLTSRGHQPERRAMIVSQDRTGVSDADPILDDGLPAVTPKTAKPDAPAKDPEDAKDPAETYSAPPKPLVPWTKAASTWAYVRPLLKCHQTYAEPPQLGYVHLFAQLPLVRDIHWNMQRSVRHPFKDSQLRDVSSLIFQVTGDRNSHPCYSCRMHRGPFEGCIVMASSAPVELHASISCCANCLYHCGQAKCELKVSLRDRFSVLFPEVDMDAVRRRMGLPSVESQAQLGEASMADESLLSPPAPPLAAPAKSGSSFGRRSERIAFAESRADAVPVSAAEDDLPTPPADDHRTVPAGRPRHLARSVSATHPATVSPVPIPVIPPPSASATSLAKHTTASSAATANGSLDPLSYASSVDASLMMGTASLNEMLEMEDWEVAPGCIQVERRVRRPRRRGSGNASGSGSGSDGDGSGSDDEQVRLENVAFSNAYLTTPGAKMVPIDHNVAFGIKVVRPGETLPFQADEQALRICSVASGKLRVRIDDAEFAMGPHSMFQVRPGQRFTVQNLLYLDVYLHMTRLQNRP